MFADVTSANVVGYANAVTTNGSQGVGAQFVQISGAGKMLDLHVTGYGDEYGDSKILCTHLNTHGNEIKKMYWFDTPAYPADEWPEHYGWYDKDGEACYNEDSLPAGIGLYFTMNESKLQIKAQSSGQVIDDTFSMAITNGSQFIANPTPVALKMGRIHVVGCGDEYGDSKILCTQLNTHGNEIKKMYWFDTPAYPADEWPEHYGWYDKDGGECYNDDILEAGAAIYFTSNESKMSLTVEWPSPLTKE